MSRQVSAQSGDLAGAVIDGLAFARERKQLGGTVAIASMPRLADILVGDGGAVECSVRGELDRDGNAFLVVVVEGAVHLQCQRCLGVLVESLRLTSRLLLVPAGQDWPDEELTEDGFDAVAAEKEMALLPLIEDEVLLALPIAPMHTACERPAAEVNGHESSPFAALASLKRSKT